MILDEFEVEAEGSNDLLHLTHQGTSIVSVGIDRLIELGIYTNLKIIRHCFTLKILQKNKEKCDW